MDQLPRLGKRELICLLLFTCNYVVSISRGFLFLWVLGMGYVILLWHSLSLPYYYFEFRNKFIVSAIQKLKKHFSKFMLPITVFEKKKVKNMQRSGTEAIRTQIQPSKPKREITNITNSQNTKRKNGQPSEQLFPKR